VVCRVRVRRIPYIFFLGIPRIIFITLSAKCTPYFTAVAVFGKAGVGVIVVMFWLCQKYG
jgi:hypothetical protein